MVCVSVAMAGQPYFFLKGLGIFSDLIIIEDILIISMITVKLSLSTRWLWVARKAELFEGLICLCLAILVKV